VSVTAPERTARTRVDCTDDARRLIAALRGNGRARAKSALTPWRGRTRGTETLALIALVIGAVVFVIGWIGLSGTVDFDRQTGYGMLGAFGILVAFAGLGGWLYGGMCAIRNRRTVVVRAIAVLAELTAPAESPSGDTTTHLLTADGMTHYHRSGCVFTDGKSLTSASAGAHAAAGRRPCPVCEP
jgi:hypothetical protein